MYRAKHRVDKKVRYGKLRIYLLIFCLLSATIFIILFKTNYFEINRIFVNGNKVLSEEEVISYSGVNMGDNIFKIKLSEAKENVVKIPYVKEATIKRKLPNQLLVDVIERKKLAAVYYMGIYFNIDNEGVILNTSHEIDDIFVIEGFEFESFIEGETIKVKNENDLQKVIELCILIDSSSLSIIPKIGYSEGNIIMYLNDDFKVKFGNGENLSERFAIFKAIYDDLINREVNSGVVDISHDGYPTYRPFGE